MSMGLEPFLLRGTTETPAANAPGVDSLWNFHPEYCISNRPIPSPTNFRHAGTLRGKAKEPMFSDLEETSGCLPGPTGYSGGHLGAAVVWQGSWAGIGLLGSS